MNVLVAFDKFKGSLDARTACEIVASALRLADPALEVVALPMADGGEGTADALIASLGGEWIDQQAMGPLHTLTVGAGYAWFPCRRRAAVEMASASGLVLLRPDQRNPLLTTTYGTGELLSAAFARDCPVWLAVGGSATVDGGVGMAMALGWKFIDQGGKPIGYGGGQLERIRDIITPARRSFPPVEVLCDVDNPLVGERGAARVFGPQKGATPERVERLEAGLQNLAERVRQDLGRDIASLPGGGAAGGLAAGAAAFLDARLVSGVDTVMEAIGIAEAVADADWIITGEGRLDETSFSGKVVSGVLGAAKRSNVPVIIIAGQCALAAEKWRALGIAEVITLHREGMAVERAMLQAAELLTERARDAADVIKRQE